MKKVTIFGVGSIGARVAFFLARSREVARIRMVDIDPGRSRATLLDFLQSNVALQSKIAFADYEEPKEIEHSDVVIIAAGVQGRVDSGVQLPAAQDIQMMEEIAAHIAHAAPQAMVAVVSQPAELFCSIVARGGYFDPAKVVGFPLLIYREWFRNHIAKVVGLSHEDVRITTVRTLDGEELVPDQCAVGGIRLTDLVADRTVLHALPSSAEAHGRLRHVHYAPAAIIAEVTGEMVGKRRQVVTMVSHNAEHNAFFESKTLIGPNGVEGAVDLRLDATQRAKHEAYRERVADLTRRLA